VATISKWELFKKLGYVPHSAGQHSYHLSEARFRLPNCGRRYGKSTMAGTDRSPELFKPNNLGWIVGPTYDLGEKEFRVMWDAVIIKLGLGRDKRVKKAYNKRQGDMWIEMPWGARVEVRSATQPERLVGEKLDWAIMSEAAKHSKETWERFIRPSLADKRGTADFPTTPEGFNWYYDLWMLGLDPSFANYECWQFPSWENKVIFPLGRQDPEILELERTTSPEWFAQEIGADFSSFVGQIYSEFAEITHVRAHEFNPAWPNYIAWDWGFVHPLAAIEFQIDPFDNIYIWREHYRSHTTLNEHCRLLQARPQPPHYRLDLMFGDAADPEATATVAVMMGVQCVADPMAKANWREGVDLVKSFLRTHPTGKVLDEYDTPEMLPKMYVSPLCPNTIREFNSYRADPKAENRSNMRESGTNSAAVKKEDDCLDAIRYALMHIYRLGSTYSLADVLVDSTAAARSWGRPEHTQYEPVLSSSGDTFFREEVLLSSGMEF
jgi:hypothetical protein